MVASNGRSTRRSTPALAGYLILGAALLLLLAVTAKHGEWVSDSWIHAATVSEVARHPWHPLEPLTGEHAPFAYFSPWAMLLGWLMRLTGLPVFTVLTGAGLAGTGLLLASWYRLVRAWTSAPWAPVHCLLLLLLLWGTGAWFWSGFPALGTLTVGFTWPSVLAAAGWFETWRAALRLDILPTRRLMLLFTLLPGLILLIHPFTAVLAAVSVGITLLGRLRAAPRRIAIIAVASLVSGLLAAAWPWISLPAMFGDQAVFDTIHHPLYRDLAQHYLLLALTAPALLLRLRRDRSDPLFWTALVCAAGLTVGYLTRTWSLARLGPGVALPGQLALGVLLAEAWTARRQRHSTAVRVGGTVLGTLTCLALLVGCYANAWAIARAVPGDARRSHAERATDAQLPYPPMSWISAHVATGEVGVANYWFVRRQFPVYGLRTVQTPWPSPGVPDEARRTADEARILGWSSTTARQRSQLLAHYRVQWIIWRPTAHTRQWPYPGARLVTCGPQGMSLLRVDPAVTRPPARCPA